MYQILGLIAKISCKIFEINFYFTKNKIIQALYKYLINIYISFIILIIIYEIIIFFYYFVMSSLSQNMKNRFWVQFYFVTFLNYIALKGNDKGKKLFVIL